MQLTEINQSLGVTGPEFIYRAQQLQTAMLENLKPEDLIEPPLKHYFANGTYVREMFAPMGSVIVGKMHRHDHICILLQGRTMIYSEDGQMEAEAPYTFVAAKGSKRIFIVLEDLIFQNVHLANSTDLDELERELIVNEDDENAVKEFRLSIGLEY